LYGQLDAVLFYWQNYTKYPVTLFKLSNRSYNFFSCQVSHISLKIFTVTQTSFLVHFCYQFVYMIMNDIWPLNTTIRPSLTRMTQILENILNISC